MAKFKATHEITLEDRGGDRTTFQVQLVDGAAYTRAEWSSASSADWEFEAPNPAEYAAYPQGVPSWAGWTFQGQPAYPGKTFSVRSLVPEVAS